MINYYEMIRIAADLINAVAEIRDEVRKTIDAAQLASQVQEETLRQETEELISRAQAADEAAERELVIRAEKAAAYRADYDVLLLRLQQAQSRDEQLRLLSQLQAVATAINGLVLDSSGKVNVPAVDLLPSAAELQQVATAITAEASAAADEVDAELLAADDEQAQTVAQLQQSSDPAERAMLETRINELSQLVRALQFEKQSVQSAIASAQSAKAAASAGDMGKAVALLDEAAPAEVQTKGLLPIVGGLALLLLNA